MKRTGCYPQGIKRPSCLADIVHRQRGWEIHAEAARKLLKTHYEGVWSPPMSLEESLAADELILANPNDSMEMLIEKLGLMKDARQANL